MWVTVGLVGGGGSPPQDSWLCMLSPAGWLPRVRDQLQSPTLDYEYGKPLPFKLQNKVSVNIWALFMAPGLKHIETGICSGSNAYEECGTSLTFLFIFCQRWWNEMACSCQVRAWYKVSDGKWRLLFRKARRRYREFIALQNALEANPSYASSLRGDF